MTDVRGFYAALGIDLPDRGGNVGIRCFLDGHDDRSPSCSVDTDTGLWKCHRCDEGGNAYQAALAAGRSKEEALELVDRHGLREPSAGNGHREIVTTYQYVDEHGELLYEAVRFYPKDFRQRRPDGNGGWAWKLGKTRRVLYRLPRVREAVEAGEPVFVLEGEKDVRALEALGLVATTNAMGAGKWRPEYTEALRGARVVVVPDCDAAGRKHAATVARALAGVASDVRVLDLAPDRDDGHDVADWLADAVSDAERQDARRWLLTAAESAPRHQFGANAGANGVPSGSQSGIAAASQAADYLRETWPAPERLLGDTAYGSGPVRAELEERSVEVLAPVPEAPVKGDRLLKRDFRIDLEHGTVTCPADRVAQIRTEPSGQRRASFAKAGCDDCPLRGRCVDGRGRRSIEITPEEELLIAARQALDDPDTAEHLRRTRPRIERLLSLLAHRYGARKSRYLGQAKALLQAAWTAALVNLNPIGAALGAKTA